MVPAYKSTEPGPATNRRVPAYSVERAERARQVFGRSTVNEFSKLTLQRSQIFRLTFPYNQDAPTKSLELRNGIAISCDISFEFPFPKFGSGLGR